LGVGQDANKFLPLKIVILQNIHNWLGLGLMYWYNPRDGRETLDFSRNGPVGGGARFIDLVQYRDRRAVVNVVLNLRVP
jgi:hypothetical protein